MHWIYTKYINLLSSRLQKFKKVNNQYNFRCPICGDSKKSENKTRGWIITKQSKVFFHCFNCLATMSFKKFLKTVDQGLYQEMVLEELKEQGERQHTPEFLEIKEFTDKLKVPEYVKTSALAQLKKVSQLPVGHLAKVYVENRAIPTDLHHKIFYAPKFKSWVNEMIPNKFQNTKRDEARLIFALLDENKELIGIQGRSLLPDDNVKYITIMLNENKPKLFGLDTLDRNKPVIGLEGPIDTFFVKNSIASCGGKIETILDQTDLPKDKIVIAYDNEPRSKETIEKMESAIDKGYSVAFWPENFIYKDPNEMVLNGYTSEYIRSLILKSAASGLEARLKLATWKKL